MKKYVALILVLSLSLCLFGCDYIEKFLGNTDNTVDTEKEEKYESALALLGEKKYEEAYAVFQELGDYKDAAMHLARFHCIPVSAAEYQYVGYGGEKRYIAIGFNELNLPSRLTVTDVKGTVYNTVDLLYDENYRLIKRVDNEFGDIHIIENFYDENGNLTKKIFSHDGNTSVFEYTYDDRGNCVLSSYDFAGGQKDSYKSTYDDAGNLIESVHTGADGITFVYSYEYDGGKLIRESYGMLEGNMQYIYEYSYDENGNLVRQASIDPYDEEHSALYIKDYTYNQDGKLLNMTVGYPNNTTVVKAYYTYDSYGNIIDIFWSQHQDGELVVFNSYGYEYDGENRVIKQIYETNEKSTTTRYSYDKYGNLEESVTSGGSSFYIGYQLMYFPFDMSEEEFYEKIIVEALEVDFSIEYPEY